MTIRLLIAAAAVLMLGTPPARADDHPCKADREKFCKDVEHGKGRVAKCMKEHEAELSEGCKAAHAKIAEHIKKVHEDCHDDVAKFCHDVKPGGGRIIRCLRKHHDELHDACKADFAKHHKKGGAHHEEKAEHHEEKAEEKAE